MSSTLQSLSVQPNVHDSHTKVLLSINAMLKSFDDLGNIESVVIQAQAHNDDLKFQVGAPVLYHNTLTSTKLVQLSFLYLTLT
jgi:hypothetical protein